MIQKSYTSFFIVSLILLFLAIIINISLGSVSIPAYEVFNILLGKNSSKPSWETIVINYRLPKTITAIFVGLGLSVSGILMQTLFRNPLAGPFVLGISSGASLGVAILILGGSIFGIGNVIQHHFSITLASSIGAFTILSVIMIAARNIKNTTSILIVGLMFGTLSGAIINILSYFSDAQSLKQYLFWSFGNLGNLSWNNIYIFLLLFCLAFILVLTVIKPLNSLLLGENYAKSLGVDIQKTRSIIFIATSLLTGVITAFSGPIAFVGLAAPHIAKLILKTSNHTILLPASAIIGSILLLFCDTIAQLPNNNFTLPINAITSLIGAPIVIWLIVKKKKNYI